MGSGAVDGVDLLATTTFSRVTPPLSKSTFIRYAPSGPALSTICSIDTPSSRV